MDSSGPGPSVWGGAAAVGATDTNMQGVTYYFIHIQLDTHEVTFLYQNSSIIDSIGNLK